jgi:alkanesulfonate monooxygenase
MTVEMIGWIAPRISSEIMPPSGPPFDPDVISLTARVHESAGFDRVLIGYFSDAPDGFLVGAHASHATDRLGFLLAHRPEFVSPTVAARKLATLDQLTGGRLAIHLIAGGSDTDQAKNGYHANHAERYQRLTEYAEILRRTWTEPEPFDHQGVFYEIRGAYSEIRCRQAPHIPMFGGGGSDAAIAALAPFADTFMLWGEPLADTSAFMTRVTAAAAIHNRRPQFSLSTRPIMEETDDKAWDRAHAILEDIHRNRGDAPPPARTKAPNACSPPPRARMCMTHAFGPNWLRRRGLQGIQPRLSARQIQWRMPLLNITNWARPAC